MISDIRNLLEPIAIAGANETDTKHALFATCCLSPASYASCALGNAVP
jgi:hypothetical protein